MMCLPCFSSARALARTSKADSVPIRDIFSASFISLLHERCRSPRPGFTFFLRNRLHVLHVSGALREDMVQIVAEADEGKASLEELADAGSPKEEDPENNVVLSGGRLQLVGGVVELRRCIHARKLVLFVQ